MNFMHAAKYKKQNISIDKHQFMNIHFQSFTQFQTDIQI